MVLKGVARIISYFITVYFSIFYVQRRYLTRVWYILNFLRSFLKWKTAFTMVVDFVVQTPCTRRTVQKLFSGAFHRAFTYVYVIFRFKFWIILRVFSVYHGPPTTKNRKMKTLHEQYWTVLLKPLHCVPTFQKLFATTSIIVRFSFQKPSETVSNVYYA